jgi:hypothetical protein
LSSAPPLALPVAPLHALLLLLLLRSQPHPYSTQCPCLPSPLPPSTHLPCRRLCVCDCGVCLIQLLPQPVVNGDHLCQRIHGVAQGLRARHPTPRHEIEQPSQHGHSSCNTVATRAQQLQPSAAYLDRAVEIGSTGNAPARPCASQQPLNVHLRRGRSHHDGYYYSFRTDLAFAGAWSGRWRARCGGLPRRRDRSSCRSCPFSSASSRSSSSSSESMPAVSASAVVARAAKQQGAAHGFVARLAAAARSQPVLL